MMQVDQHGDSIDMDVFIKAGELTKAQNFINTNYSEELLKYKKVNINYISV